MFRQPGQGGEREPASLPLPPDITLKVPVAPISGADAAARRLPARTRDERRLARIDRKVAARDSPAE
ncbi:hypothetical protein HD599_000763 [Conyzicola lurida]|uniref:Uncharacterized protein n=1 Tax=Conyzicola lurida TaxID=1172621 RepID=A0A841AFA3_9MICO|nr:hypothetical protein [Conyzicola lurida]